MQVKDLVKILKSCNQEMVVVVTTEDDYPTEVEEVIENTVETYNNSDGDEVTGKVVTIGG